MVLARPARHRQADLEVRRESSTMYDPNDRKQRQFELAKLAFDSAVESRKFEIGLFWQRSLFFWGFVAVPFIPYATLITSGHPRYAASLALFGLISSVAWSGVNRGSKRWQEHWEDEVDVCQKRLGIKVFNTRHNLQKKNFWLDARRLSVSRLAIALSDISAIFWLALMLRPIILSLLKMNLTTEITDLQFTEILGVVAAFVVLVLICNTQSKEKPFRNKIRRCDYLKFGRPLD